MTQPRLAGADDLYERLIGMHEGLSEADSHKLNAGLILLLANHVGDRVVIDPAIGLARRTVAGSQGRGAVSPDVPAIGDRR